MASKINPNALKSSVSKSINSCSIFSPDTERSTAPLTMRIFLIGSATDRKSLPLASCLDTLVISPFRAIIISGKLSSVNLILSLYKGRFNGFEIKFENKETKLVKYVSSGKLFLTEGSGLTLTKGLYFILAFVSAIKFPYISKSLALIFEPYLTLGIKLCNAGLET